jgi:hypothetical protein
MRIIHPQSRETLRSRVNLFAIQINFSIYLRLFSLLKSNFNEN